jgi:transglutaminase-like putative cysteine protease
MPGGNKTYAVSNIPDSLKKDADAIVRYDYGRFKVKNEKKAVFYTKYVVTVFNKEGRHYSVMSVGYNKFQSIEEFSGCLYDADGNVIKELDSDDIEDKSAIGGSNLYEDDRVKTAELYTDHYPYTVEYIKEVSFKGYLGWPSWRMRSGIDPVEFSRFEVIIPESQTLRYWCSVDSIKPVITKDDDYPMYVWESKNLPLLSKDVYGDYLEDFATIIQIAPKTFVFDGTSGDLTSWNTFGQWNYSLYKDKDKLPPEAVKDVHALIKPEDTRREKISKLYKYMQNRTRYVSVQLGIGGFSPFDASYVHEHAYGDCKALSNYMKALLKEAGIESNIVIINSGHERYLFINEFPSQQFDHVVLCVPDPNDTVWLECTSRLHPTGMLGDFTENRGALMLTPTGGVIVYTPKTSAVQNMQIRKGKFNLDYNGNAESEVNLLWSGDKQLDIRGDVDALSPEDREKWVVNFLDIPGTKPHQFNFSGIEARDSTILMSVKFEAVKCASISGTRLFLQPNLMGKRNYIPKDVEKRYSPVRFDNPYLNVDTLSFSIPAGYKPEALPADVMLNPEFGSYKASVKLVNDSTLIYTRSMKISTYEIPAEKYKEYRKFCADIAKADRMQAVFIRNKN